MTRITQVLIGTAFILFAVLIMASATDLFGQAGFLMPDVIPVFPNASGSTVAANGFLCTTVSGTSTLLATYQDVALTTANQNPVRLNSAGRPVNSGTEVSVFLQPATYRIGLYAAGTGNTCNNVTMGTLIRQVDSVSAGTAYALNGPKQVIMTHNAAGTIWTVYKPDGSILDTTGTTTQGLQEAITYSRANFYALFVYGGGISSTPVSFSRITCSTPITFPVGEETSYNFYGVDLVYSGTASSDFITINTMDDSNFTFQGGQIIYPGTGAAVRLLPTGTLNAGGFIGLTSSVLKFPAIVVTTAGLLPDPSRGYGLRITPANHPIIGMNFDIQEIQGGLYQIYVDSPTGSPTTGFEQNTISSPQLHNFGTTAIVIGTTSTNATYLKGNTWRLNINGVNVGSTGISTYGQYDLFNVTIEGTNGVVLNSTAAANLFTIGKNATTTPWTDSSTSGDNMRFDSQQTKIVGKDFFIDYATLGSTTMVIGGTSSDAAVGQGRIIAINGLGAANNRVNSSLIRLQAAGGGSGEARLISDNTGTGTIEPIKFYTGTPGSGGVAVATFSTTNGILFSQSCISGSCTSPAAGSGVTISLSTSTTLPSTTGLTPILHLVSGGNTAASLLYDSFGTNNAISMRRANGSITAPSAVQSSETLGQIGGAGYGATSYVALRSGMIFFATQNWTDSAQGAAVSFFTTTQGGTSGTSKAQIKDGMTLGSPTGDDKGAGTANFAADIYKNGTAFTNPKWVLRDYFTGAVDASGPYAPPFDYKGILSLDDNERFAREHNDLPLMIEIPEGGAFSRGDLMLGSLEQAMIYIYQLNARLKTLENK